MPSKAAIVFAFAITVWAFCGAIMALGPLFMSIDETLVVHAIGGPLGAALAAAVYFRRFGGVSPLALAGAFVTTALALDYFVVSLLLIGDTGMFSSVPGLWLPMALIFAATLLTGLRVTANAKVRAE